MDVQPACQVLRTEAALRQAVARWRMAGPPVALVPTMGALHEGHLALIRAGAAGGAQVVVSIFVNPKQFGPNEDFTAYPRTEAMDVALAAGAGAALVFAPGVEVIYPAGFATTVRVGGLSEGLCGAQRPGHFDGVATVVTKLLLLCLPDAAYFGEKDFQQLQLVRRLAADLNIPVRIEGIPTVREADGLAMSSRNRFLTADQRRIAPLLAGVLHDIALALAQDGARVAAELAAGRRRLLAAGFDPVDLEVRAPADLAPLERVTGEARVLAAAWLGRTRLIDNVAILPGSGSFAAG